MRADSGLTPTGAYDHLSAWAMQFVRRLVGAGTGGASVDYDDQKQ
jgi:hypothetical protein